MAPENVDKSEVQESTMDASTDYSEDDSDDLDQQPATSSKKTTLATRAPQSRTRSPRKLEKPQSAEQSDGDDELEAMQPKTPNRSKPLTTYSSRNRKSVAREAETMESEDDLAKAEIANTSEPMRSPEVAHAAASRSMSRSAAKDDSSDEGSGKLHPVSKASAKRKSRDPAPYDLKDDSPADEANEDTTENEDEPPKKKSRLPKAAETEEDSADEILVAGRSLKPRKSLASLASTPQSSSQKGGKSRKSSVTSRKAASTRASTSTLPSPSPSLLSGKTPKVLFSGSKLGDPAKKWLMKQNVSIYDHDETPTKRSNYVCVVRDESMPSSVKVLRSLIANKLVIGDRWVNDSKRQGALLDLDDYVHPDLQGVVVQDKARQVLFKGKMLYFTMAAEKGFGSDWDHVKELVKDAGAKSVTSGTAYPGNELEPKEDVVFFGADKDDKDVKILIQDCDRVVYSKSMVAQTVIRAKLDLNSDEFKLS